MVLENRLRALAKKIMPGMVSLSVADAILLHRAASSCTMPGATFLEFAAGWGFSTLCILDAIGEQDVRFVTSEIAGDCWMALRELLKGTKAELWEGDLREQTLCGELDFLFIDSDHELETVKWYVSTLLPLIKVGGLLAVHDVLDPRCEPYQQECKEVLWAASHLGFRTEDVLGNQRIPDLPPWPRSHPGVRQDVNTLVMRRR